MKRSSEKNTESHFILLTVFSIFEKIIAFVYQAFLAAVLGASLVTDSYNSASQLFDLVDTTVLGAIVVSVIHRFTDISKSKDEENAFHFLSNVNSALTVIMTGVAITVFALARPLSFLIAPGFDAAGRPTLILCIRILCLLPPIMVTASVRQAMLRQKKCFIAVNCRSLCISLCGILVLLLFSRKHPENSAILCIGYIISNLVFAFILHLKGKQFGQIRFVKPHLDSDLKALLTMAVPTIISTGIVRLSLLVDQIIASTVGTGAISYLNYALSLYHMVSNLLIVNLCMILLTDFTNLAIQKDYSGLIVQTKKAVSSILLLLVPVTILTICFSNEIVTIAYQRGAFGEEAVKQVAGLLLFYACGFIFSLMNSVYTQILYSFGDTKRAMYNTLISLGVNIVLSIIFSYLFGLWGIALGTSVSQAVGYAFYRKAAQKVLPEYKYAVDFVFVKKVLLSLLPCILEIFAVKRFMHIAFLSFGLATVIVFVTFFSLLILQKEENTMQYFGKIAFRKK